MTTAKLSGIWNKEKLYCPNVARKVKTQQKDNNGNQKHLFLKNLISMSFCRLKVDFE